jgi:hypothetical protein
MGNKRTEPDIKLFRLALIQVIIVFVFVLVVLSTLLSHNIGTIVAVTRTPTPSSNQSDLIGYVVVKSEIQPDGVINNTVDLSIDSIGVGQLSLTLPSEMNLGDSGVVRLTITPNNNLAKLINITIPTQNSDAFPQPFQFSDTIDIYPIMMADLSSAGFEITANDKPEKVILSNRPTEWVWTIKAKDEGSQLLLVRIAIPAIVEGIEQPISTPLKNIPAEVKVKKLFKKQIESMSPYVIPSLIGLIGVLLGIYSNNQAKERERKIKELEKQILEGAIEKEKLIQEVTRLKGISVWQFWRK